MRTAPPMPDNNWNPSLYDRRHSFVYEYGKGVLSLLDPQPGEWILDVGCGTGHLTKAIAESEAHIIDMDNSASMIEAARAQHSQIEFKVCSAKFPNN